MLEKKVKLTRIGDIGAYPKKENGSVVIDPTTGLQVEGGKRRQVVFESQDYRKDVIPITLFNDEALDFNIPTSTTGLLQFSCDMHEVSNPQDGGVRYYADIKMINFVPDI